MIVYDGLKFVSNYPFNKLKKLNMYFQWVEKNIIMIIEKLNDLKGNRVIGGLWMWIFIIDWNKILKWLVGRCKCVCLTLNYE